MRVLRQLWKTINRRKTLSQDVLETPLRRCLSTLDLTLLGIGHMIGAGIYVVTGTVVKNLAGPATVLAYIFAGLAAILASMCYAEFGARVPKAGSAYSYTYVTIGEFWAFIIGWNIVLEHLIGVASVGRAWSASIDSIFNGAIRNGTMEKLGVLSSTGTWISEYLDFIAMFIILLISVFIMTGAKTSSTMINIFTILNGIVMIFIIIGGFYFADLSNWTDESRGGFFPMGFQGVFAGGAACFYAFIGFEGIAVAGEEAKNPEKSIPRATVISMVVVTIVYVLASSVLTLMVPYYTVDAAAAFPAAFAARGVEWMKYVVAVGSLFGITTSLVGSLFSLPRAVYAMAGDGLFFKIFAKVYSKTQTPIYAIVTFSILSSLAALTLEIEALVEFMSIATLMAYSLVAAGVIILRYQPATKCQFKLKPGKSNDNVGNPDFFSEKEPIMKKVKSHDDFGKLKETFKNIPVLRSAEPGNAAVLAVVFMIVLMASFGALLLFGNGCILDGAWWSIFLLLLLAGGIVICFLVIVAHEQNEAFLTFQMPFVPLIPVLSIFLNVVLMLKLSYLTWIRLAVWMGAGLIIYFSYGITHSVENTPLSIYDNHVTFKSENEDEKAPSQVTQFEVDSKQEINQNGLKSLS